MVVVDVVVAAMGTHTPRLPKGPSPSSQKNPGQQPSRLSQACPAPAHAVVVVVVEVVPSVVVVVVEVVPSVVVVVVVPKHVPSKHP